MNLQNHFDSFQDHKSNSIKQNEPELRQINQQQFKQQNNSSIEQFYAQIKSTGYQSNSNQQNENYQQIAQKIRNNVTQNLQFNHAILTKNQQEQKGQDWEKRVQPQSDQPQNQFKRDRTHEFSQQQEECLQQQQFNYQACSRVQVQQSDCKKPYQQQKVQMIQNQSSQQKCSTKKRGVKKEKVANSRQFKASQKRQTSQPQKQICSAQKNQERQGHFQQLRKCEQIFINPNKKDYHSKLLLNPQIMRYQLNCIIIQFILIQIHIKFSYNEISTGTEDNAKNIYHCLGKGIIHSFLIFSQHCQKQLKQLVNQIHSGKVQKKLSLWQINYFFFELCLNSKKIKLSFNTNFYNQLPQALKKYLQSFQPLHFFDLINFQYFILYIRIVSGYDIQCKKKWIQGIKTTFLKFNNDFLPLIIGCTKFTITKVNQLFINKVNLFIQQQTYNFIGQNQQKLEERLKKDWNKTEQIYKKRLEEKQTIRKNQLAQQQKKKKELQEKKNNPSSGQEKEIVIQQPKRKNKKVNNNKTILLSPILIEQELIKGKERFQKKNRKVYEDIFQLSSEITKIKDQQNHAQALIQEILKNLGRRNQNTSNVQTQSTTSSGKDQDRVSKIADQFILLVNLKTQQELSNFYHISSKSFEKMLLKQSKQQKEQKSNLTISCHPQFNENHSSQNYQVQTTSKSKQRIIQPEFNQNECIKQENHQQQMKNNESLHQFENNMSKLRNSPTLIEIVTQFNLSKLSKQKPQKPSLSNKRDQEKKERAPQQKKKKTSRKNKKRKLNQQQIQNIPKNSETISLCQNQSTQKQSINQPDLSKQQEQQIIQLIQQNYTPVYSISEFINSFDGCNEDQILDKVFDQ